ncbi:MAG TPA: DUF3489 domain-containing protein [Bryobacteraceae bacterium]|jgi:hypothetical protein
MNNAETNDTSAHVGAHAAHVAPVKASPDKRANRKNGAPKAKKAANTAKPKKNARTKKPAAKPGRTVAEPRAESKGARILAMIRRAKGASLSEIMKATNWQAHSVRGFISTAGTKYAIVISSAKNEAGDRVYQIAK